MEIKLRELRLLNFKGIKNLKIQFYLDSPNFISGDNATGKTTIMDAFLWLIFGKDSFNRTDFSLKTLDLDGNPISRLPHEVEGLLQIDGEYTRLRRTLNEKWQKKRGSEIEEFTGHETGYFVNDVPRSQKEYQEIVSDLCPEQLFKLITNPLYFPSQKKEFQREVLLKMAGNISDEQIAGDNKGFNALLGQLSGKTLEEYKREIGAKKKIIRDQISDIPPRIDELKRNMPTTEDWDFVEKRIQQNEAEIASCDEQIADVSKQTQALSQQYDENLHKISELKRRRYSMAWEIIEGMNQKYKQAMTEIGEMKDLMAVKWTESDRHTRSIDNYAIDIRQAEKELAQYRAEWQKQFDKHLSFDEKEFICPTCQRAFEEADVEEKKQSLSEHFNTEKETRLKEITEKGRSLKKQVNEVREKNQSLEKALSLIRSEIEITEKEIQAAENSLPTKIAYDIETISLPELSDIDAEIENLEKQIQQPAQKPEQSLLIRELNDRKANYQMQNHDLYHELSQKERIEESQERIITLEAQLIQMNQQLAELEKIEFVMTEFSKAKIIEVEKRINGLFNLVRFKMFEIQINGGEVETCEATVGGVPYSDLNTGSRINAGLDIINAISKYHQYYAPIWIDNRETVTNLIDTDSQLINLLKVEGSKLIITN